MIMRKAQHSGFVALMSVIIISVIILSLVLSVSASSFYARFDAQGSEFKGISLALAESCMQMALLKISQDRSYRPGVDGEVVTVNDTSCTIDSVIVLHPTSPEMLLVRTRGQYQHSFSNLEATITLPANIPGTPQTITINTWGEATSTSS